jgi:signal transduction histidine kinase/CheY-like chemotaxis protein
MSHHPERHPLAAIPLFRVLSVALALAVSLACVFPARAAGPSPDCREIDLARSAAVLADPDGGLDVARVAALPRSAFAPVRGDVVETSPGVADTWIAIRLGEDVWDCPEPFFLSLGWPSTWDLDSAGDLALFYRTGRDLPDRDAPPGWRQLRLVRDAACGPDFSRDTPFSFHLAAASADRPTEMFLRVRAAGLRFPLVLRSSAAMVATQRQHMLFFGVYYGIVFTLVVFNLSMLLILRESGYLWLMAYFLTELAFFASENGWVLHALGDGDLGLSRAWSWTALGLVALTTGMLARSFLRTRERHRCWDLVLLAAAVLGCAAGLVGLAFPDSRAAAASAACIVAAGPFLALGAAHACRGRWGGGMAFFTLAWVVWAAGGSVGALAYAGVLPLTPVTYHAFQATSALAALLLTIAMAERVHQLRREREAAEAGSRAKSLFLAKTSHELRTPLNAILGLADYLLHSRLSPEARDGVRTIRDSGRHLLAVINDILDISALEAEKLTLDRADFDLHRLLATTGAIFTQSARDKGLDFRTDVDPATPRVVVGDPRRLRQVLINLLGNAVKFTRAGEVRLAVGPDPSGAPDRVAFTVRDTGLGMDPGQVARLFGEFVQGDAAIGRRFGGTGLGLNIAAHLAKMMGGGIEVSSSPGQGSVFIFTAVLPPGDAAAVVPEPAPEEMPPVFSEQGLRVLVVDDNPLNRKVSLLHLARLGALVQTASSGREALYRLSREPYDVVLLDLEMPDMDGAEVARRIRRGPDAVLSRDVPLVALTAHSHPDAERISREAGMDGFVLKPVNFYDLAGFLRRFAREPGEGPNGPEAAEAPVLDMELARGKLGVSREDYEAIFPMCLTELQRNGRELEAHLDGGDLAGAFRNAHTIKGTAATIGAVACRAAAARLEAALKPPGDPARLPELAAGVRRALADLAAHVAGKPSGPG